MKQAVFAEDISRFCPHHVSPDLHLVRDDLVAYCLESLNGGRILTVLAQAGSGKSQLASQVAARAACPVIWLQSGEDDARPAVFASSLLGAVETALPECPVVYLRKLVEDSHGQAVFPAIPFAHALANTLSRHGKERVLMVVDDLHLPATGTESATLFRMLAERLSKRVQLLCLARQLPVDLRDALEAQGAGTIHEDRVSLTVEEVLTLYRAVYGIPLSLKNAVRLHRATQGWTMGVVLARMRLADAQDERELPEDAFLPEELKRYFHDACLGRMSADSREYLQALALVDTASAELATRMAPSPDCLTELDSLADRGLFVRRHRNGGDTYHFHGLFRSVLCLGAMAEDNTASCARLLSRAAEWFEERGEWSEVLRCLALAGDRDAADRMLKGNMQQILSRHSIATISRSLHAFGGPDTPAHPWLALANSIFTLPDTPADRIRKVLVCAAEGFRAQGEPLGELQVMLMLSRRAVLGEPGVPPPSAVMRRVEGLVLAHADTLSALDCIVVSIARGYMAVFCEFNYKGAQGHLAALGTTQEYRALASVRAEVIALLAGAEIIAGRPRVALDMMERAYSLLEDSGASVWSRMMLRLIHAVSLALAGRHAAIERDRRALMSDALPARDCYLVVPFLNVLDILGRVREGRHGEALAIARRALEDPAAQDNPAVLRDYLGYLAYTLSLCGHADEAQRTIRQSMALVVDDDRPYFRELHRLLSGGTLALTGCLEEARVILDDIARREVVQGDQAMPEGAAWFLALCHWRSGDAAVALQWLGKALAHSRRREALHPAWSPVWGTEMIALAVQGGIEKKYARELAHTVCGVDLPENDKPVPLLDFQCMGSFRVSIGDRHVLGIEDLPPMQRHLLCLLISHQPRGMPIRDVAEYLWPGIPQESARACFDTALLRLRKLFAKALPERRGAPVLVVRNSVLTVCHARVDAWRFLSLAETGLMQCQDKPWQAECLFQEALGLWKGGLPESLMEMPCMTALADRLNNTCAGIALSWAPRLLRQSDLPEANRVLVLAHRAVPGHPQLTRLLYDTASRLGNPAQAERAITDFRAALQAGGMDPAVAHEAGLKIF